MMKVYGNIETGEVEFKIEMTNGMSVDMKMSPDTADYYAELISETTKVMRKHMTGEIGTHDILRTTK
jgi:hypothetical protein